MGNTDNDWAKHNRLQWSDGDLKGLYIDFLNQEIGFRDYPAERLEYRKIKVLLFLLEHSGEYVTNSNLQLSSELNSVDLPKTISSIKTHIVNLLSYQYDKEYSVQLFSNIIDKHKRKIIIFFIYITIFIIQKKTKNNYSFFIFLNNTLPFKPRVSLRAFSFTNSLVTFLI